MTAPLSGQYAAYPGVYSAQGYATAGLTSDYSTKSEQRFLKRDANGDGALSFEEFSANKVDWKGRPLDSAKLQEKFKKMDANGDGKVTKDEMKTYKAQKRQREEEKFLQRDVDGNGGLTFEEFSSNRVGRDGQPVDSVKLQEKFKKMDTNADGLVTREEVQVAHAQRRALKHQQQALVGAAGASASSSGTLPPGAYLQPTVPAAQSQVTPYYTASLAPGVNYTG